MNMDNLHRVLRKSSVDDQTALYNVILTRISALLPCPTQTASLTKTSNASHSGLSKGSKHSLQIHHQQETMSHCITRVY